MVTTTPNLESSVLPLLRGWRAGDANMGRELFDVLYEDLRGLARRRMASEAPDHTLAPTSLVHETFLRLRDAPVDCGDQRAFFHLVATVMRRVLVDSARRRDARRRAIAARPSPQADSLDARVLRLDSALSRLERCDPQVYRVVELRYLAGSSVVATAEVLGMSESTVKRAWSTGRAFLLRELMRDD
jgi:RNA polymerase sigma factor (TIGR02999 family)